MYLFDTNILSEVIKKKPNHSLLERLSKIPASRQFTSCICVMELRYGSSRRPDHEAFWEKIEKELLSKVRTLPVTHDTAIIEIMGTPYLMLKSLDTSNSPCNDSAVF